MIYETATFGTPDSLISLLNTFLLNAGWTIDVFEQLEPTEPQRGYRLAVNNGSEYLGFRSFDDSDPTREDSTVSFSGISGLAAIAYDSFSAASELDAQSGKGGDMVFAELSSATNVAYHFFTDLTDGFIAVVAEFASGKYSCILHGKTDKGRQYYTATSDRSRKNVGADSKPPFCWDSDYTLHVRITGGSWATTNLAAKCAVGAVDQTDTNLGFPNFVDFNERGALQRSASTAWDGTSFVYPWIFEADNRSSGETVWRYMGTPQHILFASMRIIEPEQLIANGSDQYMAFPVLEKTDPFTVTPKQVGIGYLIRQS